ncbi:hypothetical protein [Paenisporosarcina sp. TG20]|uniref:hypothetical protein n=1 Tax=Paenisporosarcina sp. TG20 TaxID=1211706 RepID=UPI000374CA41|nr:hypothetical protein [Paenisporosarcina sp. TG20]
MTANSIPNNYSNVIYLQDSFHFPESPYSNHILQLPFAKVALRFPWEVLYFSHKLQYLQARLEQHRKNPAENEQAIQEQTLFELPNSVPVLRKQDPKGRKGMGFYPLLKGFLLSYRSDGNQYGACPCRG